MKNINDCVDGLCIGSPQTFHNLTMTPLVADTPFEADYLLLDQALEQNLLKITEISDSGSVPDLKVINEGVKRVLLLDGEELIGAKQNRILNVSVMVPAAETITIPVSCVESGRWYHQSRHFSSAGRTHFAEGRARKARRVNESMRAAGHRRGDQSEVWEDISVKSLRMDVVSDTQAAAEMYTTYRHSLNDYLNEFSQVPKQTGAIFALNGVIKGVDLFDSNEALSGSLNKLVESYALDAIDQQHLEISAKNGIDATRFLKTISKAEAETYPAVGEGEDYRLDSGKLSGGALVVDDRVVHLCAFFVEEEAPVGRRQSHMARASARNRNRRH